MRAIKIFLLAAGLSLLPAAPIVAALRPAPLPVDDSAPVWEGSQFVEADRQGRIFFLRSDTMDVYPLSKDGSLSKPARLQSSLSTIRPIANATMSADGDRWLVQVGRSVRLYVDGKEKPLPPLAWLPNSVAFRRDEAIVAVIPLPLGGNSVDVKKLGTPPWLLELGKDLWETLVEVKGRDTAQVLDSLDTGEFNDILADRTAFMTADREGRLWVARGYAYRLQRYSPGGRLLFELTVGDRQVQTKPISKGVQMTWSRPMRNAAEGGQDPAKEKGTYFAFTAAPVIFDLTEGRDGRLYLLTRRREGGMALDRYDPVESVLERVELDLKPQGRFTIAAGKDGLYIAAWKGGEGRWKMPWETLDQAAWKKVEIRVSGVSAAD